MTLKDIKPKDKESLNNDTDYISMSDMSNMLSISISTLVLWVFVIVPVILFILRKYY